MQEDSRATSRALKGGARMPRILVADDDPFHLDMVTTTLVRQSFDVVGVSGGTQCLAKLRAERFDLLVIDLFMPGLDGVQLLASVRAIGIDVPVLAMTGGMSGYFKPLANSLIAVGAEVVLRKPFAPRELMAEVRRLLTLQSEEPAVKPLLRPADNFDRTIYFATRDPVTKLLNREAFEEKLDQMRPVDGAAGLICIDVNRLALVNEAQGYSAGDAVLCSVAGRLRTALAGCELARIAAGRFAALVHPPHAEQRIAKMLSALRQAMQTPIVIAGAKRLFSVSVGVALGPLDGQEGASLMTAAELAIRRAHAEGAAERWFVPQMLAEHRGRLEMESDLREALAAGRLQLHYQPKVRWPKGTVEGFEALLRWPHPSKGYIPPDTFIPVAEACGLIISLGQWVMREACRQLAEWRDQGLEPLPVAVNVSPHQLLGQPLDELLAPLAEFHIPQEWIEIEITETALMDNLGSAGTVIDDLRRVGMKISIDDFGTGHSSLGNLRRLPITTFKIDRSFVEDIETSREARDIAATIVAMARALSLDVVAEGVENERQAELLAEVGAQVMQGYLFSRPIPADVAVLSLSTRWIG